MTSLPTPTVAVFDGAAEEFKLEQDRKRELDSKHKWAYGEAELTRGQLKRRPQKRDHSGYRSDLRRETQFGMNKFAKHATLPNGEMAKYSDYVETYTSDSSAENSTDEASAAPEPDAGIVYSYDAPRGPHEGSQILSMAINKAVERFETKATEKLVKDEYEVVGKDYEMANEGYTADEDDFELL